MSDRTNGQIAWNGLCVLASLAYLGTGWWAATFIALFTIASCALGYGTRWLMRGGFALALMAITLAIVPSISVRIAEVTRQHAPQFLSLAKSAGFAN